MLDMFLRSRHSSVPVFLYEVTWGPGAQHQLHMTSDQTTVWHNGAPFTRAQIKHGEISSSGTLDNTEVEIRTPHTNPLFEVFRVYPPEQPVVMVIYRGERDDPDGDYRAIWRGRLLNFGVSGLAATFSGQPMIASTQRPGLRRNYQYGCPHVLYGPHCQAGKVAATTPATVAGVAGSVLTLEPGWAAADPIKYLKGLVEWPHDGVTYSRTVLQILGDNDLLLAGTVPGLATADAVDVVLSCNHRVDDCKDLHGNINNYGGQPWISRVNPLGPRNIFY
ncbi:phage BR0599 family protein [Halomonas pacifica]|uniref:phage BR0599 family protein n=1 Tax=Bisbaumannia pacifica TaxID=77098 RepID=UPI002359853D|nr:phage BR0599 family protein [Halomonas pacifica]MDC8804208.1 phage BR0599 family protein [Halomonas pacifica]